MFRSSQAWRLRIAFLFVAVGTFACYLLFVLTWGMAYLGLGSVLLLASIILYTGVRHLDAFDDLKDALQRFALGHYDRRLYAADLTDASAPARAFNEMASAVQARFERLTQKVSEQDAVLVSMTEGVIAVDTEEKIIRMNESACAFMGVQEADVIGRSVQEVVRNSDLLRFIGSVQQSREPVESDITIREGSEKILHAYGKTLRDSSWNTIGILVVFSDITRLRHLENVRRDFVANVSHELRTPITSIKGFIETLADGAIDNPQDARRFLDILSRQADRLNAIFEDLLTLSRIEDGNAQEDMRLEPGDVVAVTKAAIQSCSARAAERGVRIETRMSDRVVARLNENLLEQAIANLIDNAIKYSEENTTVSVSVVDEGGEVRIEVRDQGPGIEKMHLSRLFERFYRVDKARTRKAGGTGLGLAIVKHIAECHGGRATVESTPGQGSLFSIRLPSFVEQAQETVH